MVGSRAFNPDHRFDLVLDTDPAGKKLGICECISSERREEVIKP
jgi:hypothetical protein